MQIHLVTGGAGLWLHLIDRLMESGDEVICLDNYFTGCKANIARWIGHPRFEAHPPRRHRADQAGVDRIWHLACPASPIHYQFNPVKTAKPASSMPMLGLARRVERACCWPAPARCTAIESIPSGELLGLGESDRVRSCATRKAHR